MTSKQYIELSKRLGKEVTEEQAEEAVKNMERKSIIFKNLQERLEVDKKKHLQILTCRTEVEGKEVMAVKIINIDAPIYWQYIEKLLTNYCESLMEVKRTKTTLIAAF